MRLKTNNRELLEHVRKSVVNKLQHGLEHDDRVHTDIKFEGRKSHYFNDNTGYYGGGSKSFDLALPKELEALSPIIIEYIHRSIASGVEAAVETVLENIYTDEEFEEDIKLTT